MTTFMLFLVNWREPLLRLDGSLGNALAAMLAWTLPLIGYVALAPKVKGIRFGLFTILMLPVIAVATIPVLVEVMEAIDIALKGKDFGFDPIQRIPVPDGSEVVMYRTDCGATCSFGIVLRHETSVGSPLRVVRELWSSYPADTADVHLVDAHTLTVEGKHVVLRRHVVF
jgi:hypothetical protein